jgi:hypothetical protein
MYDMTLNKSFGEHCATIGGCGNTSSSSGDKINKNNFC